MITITINLYLVGLVLLVAAFIWFVALPFVLNWREMAWLASQSRYNIDDKRGVVIAYRGNKSDWRYTRTWQWYVRPTVYLVIKIQRLIGKYPPKKYRGYPVISYEEWKQLKEKTAA